MNGCKTENGELWSLDEVMEKLEKKLREAHQKVHMTAETYKTDWRTAAYIQAISRIEMAYLQRGIFP